MGQKTADSDIRMMVATQVAYLDGDKDMSVGELVNRTISNYEGQSNLSERQKSQLETAKYIKSRIEEHGLQDCNRWVIKEVRDDNERTGFYGCLIDTRDGDSILGFRGSESFDNNQIMKDWVEADFALLNNTATKQQQLAEEFTREMYDKYGKVYNSFGFTGHSLGGNLAEHATITAPPGMPIRRCINFDGPGYSDEYIIAHNADIARQSQYIDHYQYSAVGALLLPIPGARYKTIYARDDERGALFRHDTRNIEFDENGNIKYGEQDELSKILGPISKGLEIADFSPLALVCPQLAMLLLAAENGEAILLGMKNQADHLVESIKNTLQTLKQNIVNWFRSMFGVALTGEYELNVGYMISLGSGMEDVARKLERISRDASDIASGLRYSSMTGSYYKSRLRGLSGSVGRDGNKAAALGEAVHSCVRFCTDSDMQVAQLYSVL